MRSAGPAAMVSPGSDGELLESRAAAAPLCLAVAQAAGAS